MAHLSDEQVYETLHRALLALGNDAGQTVRGTTALTAARMALTAYQMALLIAIDRKLPPPPY